MSRTIRTHRAALITARALLLTGALAPALLSAQGQAPGTTPTETEEHIDGPAYGRIALLFTEMYDDNVFAVPLSQHPQSDLVSRFGPTFEVGRHSRRLEMTAKYGLAAERYVERIDLNNDAAYQNGGFEVRYNATPRSVLHFTGSYVDTQTPQELNFTTLLITGRARAERLQGHAGITQDLTPLTRLNLDYDASNDTLAETNTNTSHFARIGLGWHSSGRSSYRVDYRPRYVRFDVLAQDVTGRQFRDTGRQMTQVVTAGWTYAFTPLTSVVIDGGPRLTGGDFTPEFAGTIHHRTRKGEISGGYMRTQDISFGEVGFIDVQRVSAMLSVTPLRPLTMSATPAYAQSTHLGRTTEVKELQVDILVRVLRRLSFTMSGRMNDQNGSFTGPNDPIQSRRLWVTSTLTLP